MGHSVSILKAQYYPTHKSICNYFSFLHYPITHEDEPVSKMYSGDGRVIIANQNINAYMDDIKANTYKFKKDWYKIPSYSTYKFQKDIIENNELDIGKFSIDSNKMNAMCKLNTSEKRISNCDFFAGEGSWLVNSKRYESEKYYPKIRTLGVELVKERADILKDNKVDYYYNCAYEDFNISKESISLLLYNPPYSTILGERLTKLYLQDIINKNYLVQGAFVDFVIREDDFKDCLELLLDHFGIVEDTIFKAPSEEFAKFKQVIFTARYKSNRNPTLDTRFLINDRQNIKSSLLEKIENIEEIDLMKIPNETIDTCRELISLNFDEIMKSLEMKNNSENKVSENNDIVWNWFKGFTKIDTNTIGNLTIPKKLKQGEVINLISSGILSRQIDNHVVAGGNEQITETIKSIKIDGEGKEREQIEVRKVNVPFFNILLPTGEIKKLLNKVEIESED
jgi:hypothetical protein